MNYKLWMSMIYNYHLYDEDEDTFEKNDANTV